jgi:hypothetical protein
MHTMKSKSFRGFAAALALVLAGLLAWPAVVASQVRTGNGYYYFFQVQNENDEPFTTDGFVACSVYTTPANGGTTISYTHSAASLAQGTGVAGPLYSNTNGIIHWYASASDPVDVVCYTKAGDSGRAKQMSIRNHRLRINTTGPEKVVRVPFSTNTAVQDTGIVIPEGALVVGLAVQVATPATAGIQFAHLDVGFAGNHSAAVRNALLSQYDIFRTSGFYGLHAGSTTGAAPIQNHYGVLLRHAVTQGSGTPTTTNIFNGGYMVHVSGGMRLTYDTSNSAGIGGHFYVFYRLLHVGAGSGF